MNNYSRSNMDLNNFFDKQSTKKEAIKLLFGKDANADDKQQSEQLFPDLRKKAAKERAKEIVSHLEDMILNPERLDGKTGTDYRSWAKAARKEISQAIQEAETSAAFRELISANRIGGLCVKIGFYCLLQWPLSRHFGMASCLSGLSTALYGDLVQLYLQLGFRLPLQQLDYF